MMEEIATANYFQVPLGVSAPNFAMVIVNAIENNLIKYLLTYYKLSATEVLHVRQPLYNMYLKILEYFIDSCVVIQCSLKSIKCMNQ